jgi:hypothetical protein
VLRLSRREAPRLAAMMIITSSSMPMVMDAARISMLIVARTFDGDPHQHLALARARAAAAGCQRQR